MSSPLPKPRLSAPGSPVDDSNSDLKESSDADSGSVVLNSLDVTQHDLATLRQVRDKIPCPRSLFPSRHYLSPSAGGRLSPSQWWSSRSVGRTTAPLYGAVEYFHPSLALTGKQNLYNNYIRAPLPPHSVDGSVAKADRAIGVAGALGMGQEKSFAIRTVRPNVETCRDAFNA